MKIYFIFSDDLCRRIKSFNKSIIQTIDSKCIHQHGNIKIKNKYLKIYAREFNFTHDQLYYFYKEKNKKYYEIINNFKKKIPSYYLKLTIKLLTFQLTEFVKIYSKLKGYYKFKSDKKVREFKLTNYLIFLFIDNSGFMKETIKNSKNCKFYTVQEIKGFEKENT